MTRPLTTVPSRLLATPNDSSRSAAKLSFAGASRVCTSRAIPSPRSRTKRQKPPRRDRYGAQGRCSIGRSHVNPALRRKGAGAPSPPAGQRARDKVGDALEYGIGVERGRLNDDSVGCRDQRSSSTLGVARVAFLQFLQDIFQYSCGALLPQLFGPAPGALLGAGSDEELYLGGRPDDRPDIAAVKDRTFSRPRGVGGEIPLQVEQGAPNARDRRDDRSSRRDCFAPQPRVRGQPRTDKPGSSCCGHGIGRVAPLLQNEKCRRPVKRSGVEVGETEMLSKAAGKRALAGGRGPVDRDDEGPSHHAALPIAPPSPFIRPRKPGKLVAIGAASSMHTGRRVAKPRTRNAIAIRWSSWVAIKAPPSGGPPSPSTVSVSPSTVTRTPQAARPAPMAVRRSLSFTRSSASPRITVRPRAQAAATARIGYSSIIRGARSAGMSAPFNVPEQTRRSATGSPPSSRSFSKAMSAPISRRHSMSPVRSGLMPTPSIVTSEPGTISAAISGKAAEEGSPGTAIGAAASSGWPSRVMRFPPPSIGSAPTVAPKWRSMRSVWSRVG